MTSQSSIPSETRGITYPELPEHVAQTASSTTENDRDSWFLTQTPKMSMNLWSIYLQPAGPEYMPDFKAGIVKDSLPSPGRAWPLTSLCLIYPHLGQHLSAVQVSTISCLMASLSCLKQTPYSGSSVLIIFFEDVRVLPGTDISHIKTLLLTKHLEMSYSVDV